MVALEGFISQGIDSAKMLPDFRSSDVRAGIFILNNSI